MLPYYSFALASASATIAMPFPALLPTIVLPDFARSCSADGRIKPLALNKILKQNERWADRKAGRAYGGNDGLAFAMCAARKKRKEPAGSVEAFFCLDFLVTFLSRKK